MYAIRSYYVIVFGIEIIWAGAVWVHVSAVVSPSCRLRYYGQVYLISTFEPSLRNCTGRQSATIEEVFVNAIAEANAKFLDIDEIIE